MPTILRIAEAVLYVDDLQEATRFYSDVLEMPISASFADATFLQSGPDSTLILFDREKLGTRNSPIPTHGADGPGHVALAVPAEELDNWRQRLEEMGIEIEHEQQWPQGTRSVYFRDPAGNSVEFIEGHHYELVWQRLQSRSA